MFIFKQVSNKYIEKLVAELMNISRDIYNGLPNPVV